MLTPKTQSETVDSRSTSSSEVNQSEFNRGDWVRVKTLALIQGTLDLDGTLDGLPFMPEMAALCGGRFKIVRFANQVCANVGTVQMRQLGGVVVLTVDRCDGQFHGGCEMGCDFLWKTQWLDKVDEAVDEDFSDRCQQDFERDIHSELIQLSVTAQSDVSEGQFVRYRCQATELGAASKKTSAFNLQQYRVERETNGTSLSRIGTFLASTLFRKVMRQNENCEGPCRRTPISKLGLKIGDQVRVKSFDEIVKTLDAKGCNRGLWFDETEMRPFCGRVLRVSRKINRILDEHTGELLDLKVPSVVLNETQCSGLSRRFCGRGMLHFWREVWLERVQ